MLFPSNVRLAPLLAGAFLFVACAASPEEQASDQADEEADLGTTAAALTCDDYDATTGAALAKAASKRNGYRSQHKCFAYVKKHIAAAGIDLPADVESGRYGGSAYMFAKWAKENPSELAAAGLARTNASLDELPKGAIVVWPRGDCGYSKVHGHIEIVMDDNSSRACSDFCGTLRKDCKKAPDVFVPIKSGSGANKPGCSGGNDAAPQQDSCAGRAAGWYCSQLRDFSAFQCDGASQTIQQGYQCATGKTCTGGAGQPATMGGDGFPQCGGGQ